ncbi:MAG: universal stress protein [Rhodovarius sp.]|nr:universal stress protein [Rhodovarius sp.]
MVVLDPTPQADARLSLALSLARRFGARLAALRCAAGEARVPLSDRPEAVAIMAQLLDRLQRELAAQTAGLEKGFREGLAAFGVEGEWILAAGDALKEVPPRARGADLVILGEPDPADASPDRLAVILRVVMDSGRPVLVHPWRGRFADVGQRVLVAWDGVRDAARAVHDALPILAAAQRVVVFTVNPPSDVAAGRDALIAHLARHGIRAQWRQGSDARGRVAMLLTRVLREESADLLVMGAAGEGGEGRLGEVARAMLTRMRLPVLLAA